MLFHTFYTAVAIFQKLWNCETGSNTKYTRFILADCTCTGYESGQLLLVGKKKPYYFAWTKPRSSIKLQFFALTFRPGKIAYTWTYLHQPCGQFAEMPAIN